ncbi:hypothetical protein TNIN_302121 [Trichonephila inaurata madagascariensis]|uniref:Uncharacterized protein n=1 Tax=Trichonephila inaurata madagascariensis TaxID=2747483 RepID=A0A8X6Y6G8_9ARAC|nr:hypothetical protein TNIN_302121 [Trichonephila inaurata madagascariensis]
MMSSPPPQEGGMKGRGCWSPMEWKLNSTFPLLRKRVFSVCCLSEKRGCEMNVSKSRMFCQIRISTTFKAQGESKRMHNRDFSSQRKKNTCVRTMLYNDHKSTIYAYQDPNRR